MPNMTREEKALTNMSGAVKEISVRTGLIAKTIQNLDQTMLLASLNSIIRPCWYKTEKVKKKALFHGLIQETLPKYMEGDERQFIKTFALLELEDGSLKRADIGSVIFVDSLFERFEETYSAPGWEEEEK